MKQIIVDVSDLSIEEKESVNEALAKIKNIGMCFPMCWDEVTVLYGPSFDTINVGFDYYIDSSPTHTPQQVLEMAGMVEKREVRKDFDSTKKYTVNVLECSEEEKKEVQQAFFDAGILWEMHGEAYMYTGAVVYTNTTTLGYVTPYLMFGSKLTECNMTAKEFLELVYEPEKKGHLHSESMTQYAEDAKTHEEPWKLWQFKNSKGVWCDCNFNPIWYLSSEYRRKPKTRIVHGVEVPVFEFTPKVGEEYYTANVGLTEFFEQGYRSGPVGCTFTQRMIERGLIYPYTEEGKQAAILHSKAMLGIA